MEKVMSVWLFSNLKMQDPKVETERYIVLLADAITCFGAALYFPMMYFEEETKTRNECDSYFRKFKELREDIFNVRNNIKNCRDLSSLAGIAHDSYLSIQEVYSDLLFVLATMYEKDKWIGTCNIHKSVSGVLSGSMNEALGLIHFLQDLEANCK